MKQLHCVSYLQCVDIFLLASCPLGPVTAHGVGIRTKMHVIYIMTFMSAGPTAAAGEAVTDARKARKYMMMGVVVGYYYLGNRYLAISGVVHSWKS